ncbi:PilC/PilY family type IV pilus protein [Variovorax sp. LARHSF232]
MKRAFSTPLSPVKSGLLRAALAASLLLGLSSTALTADLADQPVFSTTSVPGNLALALSVEWPTASRTAHVGNYASATEYLGYFDPDKCYLYQVDTTANSTNTGDTSYFYPQGAASNHTCTGGNDAKWSGNFLNWASTATIDPFRWAMTGGRRVVDTGPSEPDGTPLNTTILEKAWHSGQGLFPDRDLTVSDIAGATPFAATRVNVQLNGQGFKMRLNVEGDSTRTFTARYYNSTSPGSTGSVLTVSNDNGYHNWGNGSPGDGVDAEDFSARLTGTFTAPETGNYQFQTLSDDGIRVWVDTTGRNAFNDGNRIINNWTNHGSTTDTSGNVALNAGQSFSVRMDYYDASGGATMQLSWKRPSTDGFEPFHGGVGTRDYTMRVKVCDPSTAAGGVEANCKRYGNNYKPEGLIQKYSDKMRFSAFGYLNDASGNNGATDPANAPRDGGVMRARQKFVGPTYPVPGAPASNNALREWDPDTGKMARNPDTADAAAMGTDAASVGADGTFNVTVRDSGVMNYLNKFGQLYPGNYKNFDPVSEMYYAALRYYRNLGNVPAWYAMTGADLATRRTYIDGFPVIKTWDDPIQYSCQRNFVLGIGDIYTHVDKNVPGNTRTVGERAMPSQVSDDTTVNAVTATNKVGALQNYHATDLGSYSSGRNNSFYMAGLAYDANTTDIRPDATRVDGTRVAQTVGKQTVQTYWVDVLERAFEANNQFYLAAKFGGMKVPTDFNPYATTTTAATIQESWWRTNTDTVGTGTTAEQPRPDNYFTGGRPDTLITGLTRAFASIADAIKAYTTSFSLSTAQVSQSGSAAYASQYDSGDWSGVLTARELSFATDGTPTATDRWNSTGKLNAQLAGTGWNTNRRVVTWSGSAGVPFRATDGITSAQLTALATTYGGDATTANYLDYLRGDRSREAANGGPYRTRTVPLGDIVNAKVTPVGPPSAPYGDSLNPGYAAFKSAKASRPTMVYVGANDGMLHAFNGKLESTDATGAATDAGKEVFAYVPRALFQGPNGTPQVDGLAQLGNPNYVHHYYVDATPLAFDIDLNYAGGTKTTTSADNSAWRTILIGGLGKGGRSYYALDVSDPASITSEALAAGKVLWEFTDSTMGYSYGPPVVVRTKKYGWVVVFTSGYKDGTTTDNGYLYFVNPRNGALLEKVSTGEAAPGLTYASAYVQDYAKYESDAIYVGDMNGVLWRFDLTSTGTGAYPAPVKLATLTDGASTPAAQPITTAPLIEISPTTRKRFILVGTGRLLAVTDISSSAPQSFYGILDGTAGAFSSVSSPITRADLTPITDLLTGISLSATSKGWYIDLGTSGSGTNVVGWRMVSPPVAYNGVVAFASMLTTGDACSPSGQSRVYALNFTTGKSVLSPAAPYETFTNSVTDLRFVSLNGRPLLIAGDNQGGIRKVGTDLSGSASTKLLNWRELPTVE